MNKKIEVKQRDCSDCGAACLASVAACFGLRIPVSRIRLIAGTNIKGTNLSGLIEAAEKLCFRVRAVRAIGIKAAEIPAPSIYHLVLKNGLQHFVVVYNVKKKWISYMDPALGKIIKRPLSEFEKQWSGVILLLAPTNEFNQGNEKKSLFNRFRELIMPHRRQLITALLGAVLYTLLGLSVSFYVQIIIDSGLSNRNESLIGKLSLLMIGLLVLKMTAGYFKSIMALKTGQQIDSSLILGYYRHLLDLPQRFFDNMRVGEILSRINDAVRIRVFINDVAIAVVVNILSLVFCLTIMFFYYWKLALFIMLSIPVYLLVYRITNRLNAKWQRKIMEHGAALESQLVESLQGITTIRRFHAEDGFHLKAKDRFVNLMHSVYRGGQAGFMLAYFTEGITGLLTICILWSGSNMVIGRVLSPGELISFFTLTVFFTAPVQALIGANRSLQDAMIAADRLFEITDLEKEKKHVNGPSLFPDGDLLFKNIHFRYTSSADVFSGLNLCIPRNKMTGVTGESGCGKSTLLSLIHRLYPPDAGSILIGETDIRDLPTAVLRKEIAAVPQHTDLFQGDFIFNISMGDPDPDLDRIFEICRRLGLDEMICRLPEQYQTIIREQGMNLSGGQKQRIAIARALYNDPSVIFLDEATSALDPVSEQKVLDTLNWFLAFKKTIVIIAHRPSSLKYCDTVIFLKHGNTVVSRSAENFLQEEEVLSERLTPV